MRKQGDPVVIAEYRAAALDAARCAFTTRLLSIISQCLLDNVYHQADQNENTLRCGHMPVLLQPVQEAASLWPTSRRDTAHAL